ncbi:putative ninein-like protein-like [Scophthalmus maximus]|uniref:Putative ninein-like protein-like n=1 Tax=Scophthalmus maximus TaxID=52904 RepID=A0A2U9CIN5_SCOMX|nr:putative ninein-like protein-like [Scophthalmus maximus]
MEEAEQSRYVAQLKAEFDSCDTTATGFLDQDELTALCRKLQLDAHLPPLLHTLLGGRSYARVNFQEFKEGFVSVLSRSLDFSTSEDDSSYLEPVVPEEVKPKFVKGAKRYGRRSRPDADPLTRDSEDSSLSRAEAADSSPGGVRRAKLRRSTSLESVESLKSDDEAGSQKPDFQSKGTSSIASSTGVTQPFGSSRDLSSPLQQEEVEEGGMPGGGGGGGGGGHVLTALCDHLGLQQLNTQELDSLLRKLDAGLDGRVSIRDFQKVLCGSAPISCSTPIRAADLQRAPLRSLSLLEECSVRSTSPSLLTATVGQRVLSRLDDGSGCTSPERVIALWTEEGIRNSRDILQTLDFPLEERLSLADLTLALDNELLVGGNGLQQAALISYKNELQHLQVVAEQACCERDKVRADLDLANQRNLKLVREVDDRHVTTETLNQSRIRELEQDFRDRLASLRSQSEQENEAQLQLAERERCSLQDELRLLRAQEAELQEDLCSVTQENSRLEDELSVVKLKLTEAQSSVNKLHRDMDQLLQHKFGGLDPASGGLSHEERYSEVVRELELQCRELQDRNDELSSELLKSQKRDRKSRRSAGDANDATALSWTEPHTVNTVLDSVVSGPGVSIQTELALEQLKHNHNQELQQLHIQLDTQVNYYERSLELMRQSMEVERKDIAQVFKLEISELEENKAQAEQQVKQLKETLEKLQTEIQHGGGGGWGSEQERRVQWERAELEQNFAREIGNLVHKLSAEKDQLEAELQLKLDQEVMLVREESEQHAEAQRRLLRQEQRGMWEKRLVQSEQQVRQLEEQVRSATLLTGQSEACLEEVSRHCGQLEDNLDASRGRSSELEARLQEACAQLEESVGFLSSHDVLSRRLAAEKSSVEAELQLARTREELHGHVTRLEEELGNVRSASDSVLRDRLSNAFVQLQAQVRARDQTIAALGAELLNMQDATRTRAAELDSLKTDRARLIQDLKDQAMAVDNLQLQLDGVSEELDRRKSGEDKLQEVLEQEQTRTSQLQSNLDEEQEAVCRLSQENGSYARLADQLSTQIVEMEEEISALRDHLRDLSSQLNGTADLVLDLRRQLNSRTSVVDRLRAEVADGGDLIRQTKSSSEMLSGDVCRLTERLQAQDAELDRAREQVHGLQQDLQDSRARLRSSEEEFEDEKRNMRRQLLELEQLVLALEEVMDPSGPRRTRLEEVRSENGALQERLSVLQQEVQNLEDDVAKKRRKLDETQREHERSREEEERLIRENSRCREEVLVLSSRNLQLSNDNAELSARLRGDQESVRMLQERLATVSKEQEEERATVRRLQEAATQQGREKLQQQTSWSQEKQLIETELSSYKEQLVRLAGLEEELSTVTFKLQRSEEDKVKLLREADARNDKVAFALALHSGAVGVEKLGHAQEVTELQRKLQEAQAKLAALTKVQVDLRTQAEEQAARADSALGLLHVQQAARQQQAGDGRQVEQLQRLLLEGQRRSQTLEDTLKLQAQQSSVMQEQYEKAAASLRQRTEDLETKLNGVRSVLQEKVQQLKDQLTKNAKSSSLLKDVYVENAQLMAALQVTEQRQKKAEKKNVALEEKVGALNKLLREIVPAALAT